MFPAFFRFGVVSKFDPNFILHKDKLVYNG